MNARKASLEALKGLPIRHKDFEKGRWLTFTEVDTHLELFDSFNSSCNSCWASMIEVYGHNNWEVLNNSHSKPEVVHQNDQGVYLDATYLSDQIEELADLLTKTLELADRGKK